MEEKKKKKGHCENENCEHDHEHNHECECGHEHHDHEHHDGRYEYILSLEADLKEAEDKVLRSKADMINYRRRMEEEQNKIYKYSNENMIKELLPIIDNFERAILMDDADLTDEVSKFLIGFKMIFSELQKVLKEHDVKQIEALNKEFDANYHEAVLTEKSDKKSGIVIEILQKGYMYKDKVIRPVMVKVSE